MPITVGTGPGFDHSSIQAAINAADPGDTITVAAGVYEESLSITEGISIVADPGAILKGPLLTQLLVPPGTALNDFFEQSHPAYSQSTGIAVSSDDVSISGLTITGFVNGVVLNTSDGVTLEDNTFIDNVNGIRKGEAQQVTDITVNGNTFTQGIFGLTVYAAADGSGSFDGVTMNNNSFSELSEKGMYFEQLSNATLDGNEFDDVGNYGRISPPFGGTDGEFGQAIDINLKYETYSNVTFTDTEITNSGNSDKDGAGSPGTFGAAIGVKIRDDAPSYHIPPATFTGQITFDGLTIDGTSTGVRVGEPGKNNLGPDVLLQDVTITNATVTDVSNATNAANGGTTTVELSATQVDFDASQSQADVDVTGNGIDNTISTGGGDDTIDGGGGTDEAAYAANLVAANFSYVAGKWVVAAGAEGTDTLDDIEKVLNGGANTFLLVGGDGYTSLAAAEADQQAGDIILTPSTPVVSATAPAHLVEAAAAPGTSSATATITKSDPIGSVDYDFAALVGWANLGGGIFTKAGALGTATLNTNANTLTFALNNAAANSLSADDHPTVQFTVPVVNGFGVKSSTVVTFTIDGRNDAPSTPADANAAPNRVREDANDNDLVGLTAHSTDAEGDTLTYALTDNAGGRFKIDATTGVVTVRDHTKLDFETATSHLITVRVSDGHGGHLLKNFTIRILDADGNTINGTGGNDTISGTEGVPQPSGDAGLATPENDTIFGGAGNDTISSLAGKDVVNGGGGKDTINGGDAADRLVGGADTDTASYLGSDAGVTVDLSRITAQSGGDAQGDRLSGFENLLGSQFADNLTGNGSSNVLRGGAGFDDLRGGGGNDDLQGGNGQDDLRGGAGADKLVGGAGNDVLRGNAGSDTFVFGTGSDADLVRDYAAGADEFDLSGTSIVNYNQLKTHMTNVAGDVVIDFGGGDTLTILNTTIAILNQNAQDFHF